MKIFAETERLVLREMLPEDLDGMFELDSDPEVHRYLGNKPVTDKKESEEMISFVRQQYETHGIGRWAVIDKKTNEFMGWAGLKYITELTNNHRNYYDLGYRLIRRYWGQGIASEAALISLEYAFNELKLTELYAAACENAGSNHILKKIGMKLVETFYYEDIPCNWYKMDRVEFENNRSTINHF
jgi:RimJ/RimL family protein N-acetyltransferase